MKNIKTILLITLFVLASIFATAQEAQSKQFVIKANYGRVSVAELGIGLGSGIIGGIFGKETKTVSLGVFSLAGEKFFSERFSGGLSYSFESIEVTDVDTNDKDDYSIHTPMVGVTYRYINGERFRLYGRAGAGAGLIKGYSKDSVDFAYQISPIGISYGNKIAVNLDIGFGWQGMAVIGLQTSF